MKAIDMGGFYRVPADTRDLNYDKYFIEGNEELATTGEYNSLNTYQLNVEQLKDRLISIDFVRKELDAWRNR